MRSERAGWTDGKRNATGVAAGRAEKESDMDDFAQEGWVRHEADTFAGRLGMVLERPRDGGIEMALRSDDTHRNLGGILHGGVIMTMFDRTMGINCRNAVPGARFVMASMNVNFLRQVAIGDFLVMTCRLRKTGRRAIFADAEARVGEALVATASGVVMQVAPAAAT